MPPSIAAMLPISHSVCALLAAAFLLLGASMTGAQVCRLALLTGVWFVSAVEALRVVAANSATPIGRGEAPVHGNMRSRATCVHGNMGFKFLSAPSGEKLHDTLCEKLHEHCTDVSLHLAWATIAALPGRAKIHPHALAPELVLRAFAGGPSSATVLNFRHF